MSDPSPPLKTMREEKPVDVSSSDETPLSPRQSWKGHVHFYIEDGRKHCRLCPSRSRHSFSIKSSNWTLSKHLEKFHGNWNKEIKSTNPFKLQPEITNHQKSVVDSILLELCIEQTLPFHFFHSKTLTKLFNFLLPGYKIPSRFTIQRRICSLCDKVRLTLKNRLQEVEKMSLTLDLWTSRNHLPFLGITVHFLENYSLRSVVLDMKMVSHPHTAEHIAETLKLVLHDFGILEKIVAITTDNGKNVTKAVDILSAEFPRIQSVRCMGHVLNLAVQEGLDIVADVISKTRELAKLLHRSSKQRELFILIHNQLNLSKEDNFNDTEDSGTEDERVYSKEEEKDINSTFNGPSLPLDVITRWNSTFKMLSAYKQLEATIAYFLKKENLQHFILNDTEEKAVNKYIKVLMPFDSATKILSGDKYPTLGLVIAATVHCYSALLVEHSNDEEDIIVTAIEKMKEKMLEYVPFMYNYTSFKGTLLDPRFKDRVHPSLMNKSDYKDKLKSELQTVKPHNVGGKTLATPCHFFPTRTDESKNRNYKGTLFLKQ
ncbi:hypothetical protein RCL1_007257 [Eukaryota sp. TZLM3-RCL]